MATAKQWSLWLGPPLAAIAFLLLSVTGHEPPACWTGAVTTLCAAWWICEPVPLAVTALTPFVIFPLTGVLTHKDVAASYGDTLILLFMGGFMLSAAMEKSGAHRRVALGIVRSVGGRGGRWVVLAFMLATAALSMWISNTACALMMLPVAMAVIRDTDDDALAPPLLLGIAYAASIGGIGTPIGSPPNIIFMGVFSAQTGRQISFPQWMTLGVPVVLVMLPLAWLWLTRRLRGGAGVKVAALGPWTAAQVRVLAIFAVTAALWVTREAPFGGWSGLIGAKGASDSTVALGAVMALFLIRDGKGEALLDWPTAARIPWGILLLFGGGIAIARAFDASGLSASLGNVLSGLAGRPAWIMIAIICLAVTFLTEVTSNTATTALLMPILAAAGLGAGINPVLLMAPAALSASCAFMLPVATPPNAIIYGAGSFPVRRMASEGLAMNLIGVLVIGTLCYFIIRGW